MKYLGIALLYIGYFVAWFLFICWLVNYFDSATPLWLLLVTLTCMPEYTSSNTPKNNKE